MKKILLATVASAALLGGVSAASAQMIYPGPYAQPYGYSYGYDAPYGYGWDSGTRNNYWHSYDREQVPYSDRQGFFHRD